MTQAGGVMKMAGPLALGDQLVAVLRNEFTRYALERGLDMTHKATSRGVLFYSEKTKQAFLCFAHGYVAGMQEGARLEKEGSQ